MATPRQTAAAFYKTGCDVRHLNLTQEQCDSILSKDVTNDDARVIAIRLGGVVKRDAKTDPQKHVKLWALAVENGQKKAEASRPVPMIVTSGGYTYEPVEGGVCGFAWVNTPGNTSFGKWAKKNAGFRKAYHGGVDFWVSDYGQSMTRKEEFARGVVEILENNGVKCHAGSRMD